MMKYIKLIGWSAFIVLIWSGCNCNKNKKKPNLSGIEANVPLHRFEKDFFAIHPDSLPEALYELQDKYGDFVPFYLNEILGLGDLEKDTIVTVISASFYLNDKYVREVADTCLQVYGNFDKHYAEIVEALRYFNYYFPNKHIPDLLTFTSNFSYSAISFDTLILAIGVDMYLGENYKFYPSVYPQYIYEKFRAEY